MASRLRRVEAPRTDRERRRQSSDATTRALTYDEAARASSFGRITAVMCLSALVFLPFQRASDLRTLAMIAVAVCAGVGLWVGQRASHEERYSPWMLQLLSATGVTVSGIVVMYVGVYSAAPIVVTLGITFFGQGDDRRWAIGISLAAAAFYALWALLVTGGLVRDPGLVIASTDVPKSTQIWAISFVPTVYLLALWQARKSRASTVRALERLHEAMRVAENREALLAEANLEIAAARGMTRRGRFTGMLAGAYRLSEMLGSGGTGEVYLGTHVETGAEVAVKVLFAGAEERDVVARFRREAETLERVRSPHVVRIYANGELEDGSLFLVMERLVGEDMARVLRRRLTMEIDEVVEMCSQVAEGLAAAHAVGIVHRDIKPSNIFRTEPSGKAVFRILDFGAARIEGSSGTLTGGQLIGTPNYMSPEQARGDAADARSDVFSLAAVVYRAVTGRPPFAGPDAARTLYNLVFRKPPAPHDLVPSLPRAVDDVLAVGLAKDPAARFETPKALAVALSAVISGSSVRAIRTRARAADTWDSGEPTLTLDKPA
jgi:serine/threonine-protein kinase